MRCTKILLILFVIASCKPLYSKQWVITDFGAKADTTELSTKAIQQAINSCNFEGGGVVLIPSGMFKTGTLILKSNVTLYLEKGAVLFGSKNINDYQSIIPRFVALRTRKETKQLIYAEDAENISLNGEGTINGQGIAFRKLENEDEGTTRPHLIQFIHCQNISVNGIKLRNSGAWMQHYLACTQVKIEGIEVYNHSNYNNDGIDIDGCKEVLISNVLIDSDDDGICLKSTSDWGCENVVVSNSIVSSHCNALKLGTESNTGFRNIIFTGIVVKPSKVSEHTFYGAPHGLSGISVEMVDGGILDQVVFSSIIIEGTESPLFIRLGNRARPYLQQQVIQTVGTLTHVTLENINITNPGITGCSITGIPGHLVTGIKLNTITIESKGDGLPTHTEREIPELEKNYPESVMFGTLPAYGFYIRHAADILFDNIKWVVQNDSRPALYLDDVHSSQFQNIAFKNNGNAREAIRIENSHKLYFKDCWVLNPLNQFITINGTQVSEINILNNQLKMCKQISVSDSLLQKPIFEYGNSIE